ncbi:hypothetical protein KUCAC02_025582 [Chaenocephalus aceratus]|uniref:Uncharacterized protein n=1 Tax=Chaenocephalus aceratus TaxID=36190 RepID=A0ACB9VVQ7_CHAAC|nr:hypothetical protein KUCAC02_025582 [Chaenocephalus aceratus]
MLKKEKKRAQDAVAQLANTVNGQRTASQDASGLSTMPLLREGSPDSISTGHRGRAIQHMKRGPQLSMGKQEAFEIFVRDHEDHLTIEDNKKLLKQSLLNAIFSYITGETGSAEARRIGEELNEARNRINELKKQLEVQRRQRAAHAVMQNHQEVEEEEYDPVEENLCKHIEQEKKAYKSAIGRLKALRTEIEHLQLLLERAKVKLQKDFHQWWSREASSVQESEATARSHTGSPRGTSQPSSPSTPGFRAPVPSSTVRGSPSEPHPGHCSTSVQDLRSSIPVMAVPEGHGETLGRTVSDFTPSSDWRSLSTTTLSSSSIPLTGDQKADADILAFVRARQNLLSRTELLLSGKFQIQKYTWKISQVHDFPQAARHDLQP